MRGVLISIEPTWCCLIASGRKTVEIRKTAPKIKTPFKCYIYCTKAKTKDEVLTSCNDLTDVRNGKVIGEFVCDKIDRHGKTDLIIKEDRENATKGSCVSRSELYTYLGAFPITTSSDKKLDFFCWHISDLRIYEKPKDLGDFRKYSCNCPFPYIYTAPCEKCDEKEIKRPPQSWCYVEELPD